MVAARAALSFAVNPAPTATTTHRPVTSSTEDGSAGRKYSAAPVPKATGRQSGQRSIWRLSVSLARRRKRSPHPTLGLGVKGVLGAVPSRPRSARPTMSPRPVVTRFAPSPTGFLHIGGARTALFNMLYARHTGGTFLLRVEDTDRERSTEAAVAAIFEGLNWLGVKPDAEPVFQAARADRHRQAVMTLLETGHAYRCHLTVEELEAERERARLSRLAEHLAAVEFQREPLEAAIRAFAGQEGVGVGKFGAALRGVLSGGSPAPDLATALTALGRDEALGRILDGVS